MDRQAKAAKKRKFDDAFKIATLRYKQERDKPNGISASAVSKIVEQEHGVSISERSIQRYVKNDLAGKSPLKQVELEIYQPTFTNLCVWLLRVI